MTLESIDLALLVIGAVVMLYVAARWLSGGRGDPLRKIPARDNRLALDGIVLPIAVWLTVGAVLGLLGENIADDNTRATYYIAAGNAAQLLGLVACLWVASRCFAGGARRFIVGTRGLGHAVRWGVAGLFAALTICAVVLWLTQAVIFTFFPNYPLFEHEVIDAIRQRRTPLLMIWIGTTIIAPVAEECFFRGIVQNGLENLMQSRWAAVLITGLVFGAIHAGAGDSPQPHVVPALTVLGIVLGVLYLRTGSLVAPIILHALFNAKTLLWETLALGAT